MRLGWGTLTIGKSRKSGVMLRNITRVQLHIEKITERALPQQQGATLGRFNTLHAHQGDRGVLYVELSYTDSDISTVLW